MRSIAPLKSAPVQMTTPAPVPVERWLAPKELAGHFGLKEDSAYRWIDDGTVPREFVRYIGRRRIRIHPEAIPFLEKLFEAAHA